MSEPPSRGPERDLFRDTWVRYLGELRARGTANPQHVARGSRNCQRPVGAWRLWEHLSACSAGAETAQRGL